MCTSCPKISQIWKWNNLMKQWNRMERSTMHPIAYLYTVWFFVCLYFCFCFCFSQCTGRVWLNSSAFALLFNLIAIQAIIYILKEKREKRKKEEEKKEWTGGGLLGPVRDQLDASLPIQRVEREPSASSRIRYIVKHHLLANRERIKRDSQSSWESRWLPTSWTD